MGAGAGCAPGLGADVARRPADRRLLRRVGQPPREAKPLVVRVQLGTIPPIITVPPDSPLAVDNNRIVLEDGRELLLEFVS